MEAGIPIHGVPAFRAFRGEMVCISCVSDYHSVCLEGNKGWCCCSNEAMVDLGLSTKDSLIAALSEPADKEPKVFDDHVSTGRKRAAKALPIPDGMGCQWAGLKSAGGGVIPIVGCRPENENLARHRHHGPDKSVFNNEVGVNLHGVCTSCHNRWHTRNDNYYGVRPSQGEAYLPKEPMPCLPHDGTTLATNEDLAASDLYWSKNREFKAKDEPDAE